MYAGHTQCLKVRPLAAITSAASPLARRVPLRSGGYPGLELFFLKTAVSDIFDITPLPP